MCIQYGFCGLGGLQECKDNFFLKPGRAGNFFRSCSKKIKLEATQEPWVAGPGLNLSWTPSLKSLTGVLYRPASFTYDVQLGCGFLFSFFPLGQDDGYPQLAQMDLKIIIIISAHVACSMKKVKSPKMTSCGPCNFEGDGLHLNLLKENPSFLGVAHLSCTEHIMTKTVMKRNIS